MTFKFDKVFVVNLDRRIDRLTHINEELSKLGWTSERFPAFDGTTLDSKPGKPPVKGWTTISMGNYGNVLSQRAIIQLAKEQGLDSILILEDDAEFDSKEKIEGFLELVPRNWDMLYFGGNHQQPLVPINDKMGRCQFTLTAHAVGIKHTMYDHILHVTSDKSLPIDLYYAQFHRLYNVYCPLEKLSWQINGYSDIEEKEVDYSTILR